MSERFLVTGAYGCIGAWVVRQLVEEGVPVVAYDLGGDPRRLRQVVGDDRLDAVTQVAGDVTDLEQVEWTLDEHGITRIVHLAALQVPFCRADPPLGARVNVVGTVNVLEAAARRADRVPGVVYASSIAALDDLDGGASGGDGGPSTIYGVYKLANEGSARIYAADRGVASIGLRPHTVYGVARDQGLTSAPTTAMLAAAAGVPYEIPFGGRVQLQFAPDVARAFVAAARSVHAGAGVHNLAGSVHDMDEVVAAIEAAVPSAAGTITVAAARLPFPERVDASSLPSTIRAVDEVPLAVGVAATIERFRELLAAGLAAAPAAR